MKRLCLTAVGLLFSLQLLHGQAQTIIKQKAKDLRDQNNAKQGVPPSSSSRPTPPAPNPSQPAPAVPLTAQQQAIGRLQNDLIALRPGSAATDKQKHQLAMSLSGVAYGKKPTAQATAKLANGLADALGEKQLTNATRSRLLQNLSAVMNAEKFGQRQIQDTVADLQKILKDTGVSESVSAKVGGAARDIVLEIRKTTT
jgi:hypothetical protein